MVKCDLKLHPPFQLNHPFFTRNPNEESCEGGRNIDVALQNAVSTTESRLEQQYTTNKFLYVLHSLFVLNIVKSL